MVEQGIKNYYEVMPESGGKPSSLVFLLHGLGSNGRDLLSLAPQWKAYVPGAAFISPDAPFACDMVPPGYPDSFQWFSLHSHDPMDMLAGIKRAAPLLRQFMKSQMERFEIAAENVALVGFSQGGMMSLFTAPRFEQKLAGVVGYSGALLGGEELGKPGMHKIPVHLIHGVLDNVVPVGAWYAAKMVLQHNGYEFSGHTSAMLMHSIDEQGIASGGEFLKKILPGAAV